MGVIDGGAWIELVFVFVNFLIYLNLLLLF